MGYTGGKKGKGGGKEGIDWKDIGISVVIWIALLAMGLLKITIGTPCKRDAAEMVLAIIDTANNCTFSAFISVVACMLYQHFSIDKKKRLDESSLALGKMPFIIIATIFYAAVALLDSVLYCKAMKMVFLVANIGYVACFFVFFVNREKGKKKKRKKKK